MNCTMPEGCQGSPWSQKKEERPQSSPVGLQDASPCWGRYSKISEPPSVLGHCWWLGTHHVVETSSQHRYPQTASASGRMAGGEQMVPLTLLPETWSTHSRMTKAGGGTRLIPRSIAALASATSQPCEVPPAAGLGRRQVPAAGELGTRAPREQEQEHDCRRTAGVGNEAKTFKPQTPGALPALPVAPQTNVIKHWEQADWTSA